MNHFNFAYSAGIPLAAGDRYYAQDLGREFYYHQDAIGSSVLLGFGVSPGTPSLLKFSAVTVDGISPNTTLDIPAGGAVLPFVATLPDSFSAIPPSTLTTTVNIPVNWDAFTIDVSTLGCTGVQAYKLYATYTETVQKTRARVKASGTYGYEVKSTLSLGATTGSIPANSVLMATFTYNSGSSPISGVGQATTILGVMSKKNDAEYLYRPGSIHPFLNHESPSVWNATNPKDYLPVLNLSAITGVQVIDSTGTSSGLTLSPITKLVAPQWVTWARARKMTIREGMTSPKSDFTLSTYQLTSNVVTLTFAVDVDLTAMLNVLAEWALVEGASADLLTYTPVYRVPVNIPSALGAIPAGDYGLTSITPASRQITFAYTHANIGSTATSVQCAFYPHRIPGSSTTAKISAVQGRALVGANDGLLENVAPAQRRGRIQDHLHEVSQNISQMVQGAGINAPVLSASTASFPKTSSPVPTGSAGTPRLGPETDVRNMSVHFHMGLGPVEA